MQMKRRYSPQALREKYIRALDESSNSTVKARKLAEDLFALDLTVYSKDYSFNSAVYNAFATSLIDETIALHPEQLQILSHIKSNAASIISAPTSFGKTFCIFEYIVKYKPRNVVLIVPTLALVDEYFKKIIKRFKNEFSIYKIHTGINEDVSYDFRSHNIFILTHERIVHETSYSIIEEIDFLVVDEVYKLETDSSNDRVLVLNMAYYHLAKVAKKYVLLAPFIKEVRNTEKLEKAPVFFKTNYSPVVNEVKICSILSEQDRFEECKRILSILNPNDKTLIYFPTVTGMYKYISNVISNEDILPELDLSAEYFIKWAKEEIHEEWCLVVALERGYVIHNGQIPVGTRMFQLDFYEKNDLYNKMLCTSTLLEGVNTTAKNIIITKPSRKTNREGEAFTAFDFFNLVGRTGRLHQHYIGDAYYIQSPNDPDFKKAEAIRSIEFEITDSSIDIDIQTGLADKHPEFIAFLEKLGITVDEYLDNIGTKIRFATVLSLYGRYLEFKGNLINVLTEMYNNPLKGRPGLVKSLFSMCEQETQSLPKIIKSYLISGLLSKTRPRIKSVVDKTRKYYSNYDINHLISMAINLKTGYIEHTFYNRVSVIRFFMQKEKQKCEYLAIIDDRILHTIEFLYFSNIRHKKMLLDMGVYERDVDKIIKIIGDDFSDAFELKQRLTENIHKLKNITYISSYVIKNII